MIKEVPPNSIATFDGKLNSFWINVGMSAMKARKIAPGRTILFRTFVRYSSSL